MKKQNNKNTALIICAAALLFSTSAHAGFEFTAPVNSQVTHSSNSNQLLPTIDDADMLPPIIQEPISAPVAQPSISWSEENTNPVPTAPSVTFSEEADNFDNNVAAQPSRAISPTGIMSMSRATSAQTPTIPKTEAVTEIQPAIQDTPDGISQYDMAVGFGKDLPLISALRQVVPSDYTYVLNTSIDSSQTVSWNGGQEWPTVLNNMLSPQGLSANVTNNIVTIQQANEINVPTNESLDIMPDTQQKAPIASFSETLKTSSQSVPKMHSNQNIFIASYTPSQPSNAANQAIEAVPVSTDINTTSNTFSIDDRRPPVLTRMDETNIARPYNGSPVSLQPNQTSSHPVITNDPSPIPQQNLTNYQNMVPSAPVLEKKITTNLSVSTTENDKQEQISVIPEVTEGQWLAQSGASLKTVLESWSSLEGVDLFWSSDYDYILAGDVNINGTYEAAVKTLLEGFSQAQPKPMGRLHPNLPNGPAVLVIETRKVIS